MKTKTSDKLDTKSVERPTYKALEQEVMEQARLNGMGSEREARLMARVAELERENAALKAALDAQMKYQKELRTDRDRLDWLEEQYRREQKSYSNVETEESALTNEVRLLFYTEDKKVVSFAAPSFRAALDAARKEAT